MTIAKANPSDIAMRASPSRTLSEFQQGIDLSTKALCGRMFERHRKTIRTQKAHVAVANLVRITKTTLALSNRKGFHSMSLRDLATETGLSMGALYNYFDSKETLLLMILGEVAAAVKETLCCPPRALEDDPAGRLRWLLETHVYLTETMQPWFVFAYMEAKTFSREGRDLAVRSEVATETLIAVTLADGVARNAFVVRDIDMTAAIIKPLLQDWYVKRGKYRRRGVPAERYVEAITAFVEAALRR
jgi:AcrR family transcriptional regulator